MVSFDDLLRRHPDAVHHVRRGDVRVDAHRATTLTLADASVLVHSIEHMWTTIQSAVSRFHADTLDDLCTRIGKHNKRESLARTGDLDARDCGLNDRDISKLILLARTGHFASLRSLRLERNVAIGAPLPAAVHRDGITPEGALQLRMDVLTFPQNWPELRVLTLDHDLSCRRERLEYIKVPRMAEARIRAALGADPHVGGVALDSLPGFWAPVIATEWALC